MRNSAIKLRFIMNFRKIGKDRKAEGGKLFIFSLLISGVKVGALLVTWCISFLLLFIVSIFFFPSAYFLCHFFRLLQAILCFFFIILNRSIYICFLTDSTPTFTFNVCTVFYQVGDSSYYLSCVDYLLHA